MSDARDNRFYRENTDPGNYRACFEHLSSFIRQQDWEEAAKYVDYCDNLRELAAMAERLKPTAAGGS